MAIFSVITAYFLLHEMKPHLVAAPAALFLCAIMLSAWLGGIGPGLFAILLSILFFDYFFVEPIYSFAIASKEVPRVSYFFLAAIFIGGLTAAQKATIGKARRARNALARANLELENTNQKLKREIVERERINAKLRYSEALLTEGQKISHTGSWHWNLSLHELTWSDEHYRIFGVEPSTQLNCVDMYRTRVHPDDALEVQRIARQAIANCERFECEFRIILPAENIRYIHGIGCPVLAPDGHFNEYIGISVDITEQRQTEDLLRKSELEFRTLAENSPDGVIRYDRDCKRIYVNPAHLSHMGVPHNQVVNVALDTYWGSDSPVEEYRQMLRQVMETGNPAQAEGRWTRQDGNVVDYSVHVVAERDSSGEVKSVLAISRNITSIKETENCLKESRHLLRQLADRIEAVREEELKYLARELHDDLAQYLTALRMRIAVLKMEFGAQNPALPKKVDAIIELVDSAIDVTRSVITTLRPIALDIGISAALEWLADDFSAQKDISCGLHIDADDIQLSDKSATAIFRIAQEALRNVARHSDASMVSVVFNCENKLCFLEIRDDGKGFDPSIKKANSFGLIGIQERALMLDGEVTINSAPSHGTTIQVHIPIGT